MTIRIDPSKTTRVNPSLGATQQMYPCWQPSSNYAEITIDHTQLTGDVTDLVIPLTGRDLSAGFWSAVDAAGLSIVVTDAHSNRILRRQVPYINVAGETLEVYVRVPRISATTDTDLLLSVAPYTLAQDMLTWPSSWVFASDMSDDDAGTGILDWSRFANHGTKGAGAAAPTEVAGSVGRAQQFVGQPYGTIGQYILVADASSLDFGTGDWSITTLVNRDASGPSGGPAIVTKRGTSGAGWDNADAHFGPVSATGRFGRTDWAPRTSDVWESYSVSVTQVASPYVRGFIDGVFDAAGYDLENAANLGSIDNAEPLFIGRSRAGEVERSYGGLICEVWISSVALSPDEHAAIDAALRGTATFYGVTNHF